MRRRNRWLKTLFWGSVLGVFLALVLVFSGVAVAAGELVLGHVAYDLLHLEEALEHYRKAAESAEEGSRE